MPSLLQALAALAAVVLPLLLAWWLVVRDPGRVRRVRRERMPR